MNKNIGRVSLTQSRFIWEITEIRGRACICRNIRSPVFITMIKGHKTRWVINMTFDEIGEDGQEYIGIYLESRNNYIYEFDLEFAILDLSDKEVYRSQSITFMDEGFGFSEFIKKDELLNQAIETLIFNDRLRIICTITTDKYIDVKIQKHSNQMKKSLRLKEYDNLLDLFLKGTFSDIVFHVEGKEIPAHKSIVANRSPVFEAMFKHDMKETNDNIIVVTDIPFTAMYDLLKFIYSGKVATYWKEQFENYTNLMIASDKYGIENLKTECERILLLNVDVDNVFKTLNLADTLNSSRLKERAIEFIAENGDEMINSPAYKEFGRLHSEISSEAFHALIIKKRKMQ